MAQDSKKILGNHCPILAMFPSPLPKGYDQAKKNFKYRSTCAKTKLFQREMCNEILMKVNETSNLL